MEDWFGKKMSNDEFYRLEIMHPSIAVKMRKNIIKEIKAFSLEYSHNIEGRDVVIVDQLIDFLDVNNDNA